MTFTTKTAFAALALIAASVGTQASAKGNAGASMAACASHVISACNENSKHPEACTSAGLDACEELHGSASQAAPAIARIRIIERPDGTYRVVLEGKPVPRPGRNSDEDAPERSSREASHSSAGR
ncbi:hypothetical protein OE699_08825 [Sedimentimonas flavescens]|uniref:Uncharacterized protein n=1 Tax=Sedimentimonas flavescens TaxID=2851012 RepID=A0ABT2ZYX8_9RHOB|nr:hypothetical protein [Sedimentimonas flavescens]MBW0158191.1 hypothetical protein [Sedimentimonas flavescens]MCT2539682.1 hypothetical protein [Sedimentimonas flavescens]MCV2878959.1 hypothetical protein [Sedimentimonas flavescens]WBL33180.1 hypothetical protein O5O51_00290 [Sinirhodobacter sp. HNIBRBA609]